MIQIPKFAFDVIAERELEYRERHDITPRTAKVRFGRPVFVPPNGGEGCWLAPYEILVDGEETRARHVFGEDGIQALQLVNRIISAELSTYPGQFQWLGTDDLGFP
jgi:hypothetical protein